MIQSLPVTTLTFEPPPPPQPILPNTLATVTESMSVAMEPLASSAPTNLGALSTSLVETASTADDSFDDDDDPDRYLVVASVAPAPSSPPQ